MIALLVFLAGIAIDWAWILYMHHAAKKNAVRGALWSMTLVAIGALNVIAYTEDHALLICFIAGCGLGTYSAIKWGPK